MKQLTMVDKKNKVLNAASILKSIGHPIRVEIILALSQRLHMNVTELSDFLGIEQPVMSLHLSILRKKKIITSIKEGTRSVYKINNNSIKQIIRIIYYSKSNN